VTRRQCDELAFFLVGEPANPAPIQRYVPVADVLLLTILRSL
jgi:hypothetical protein